MQNKGIYIIISILILSFISIVVYGKISEQQAPKSSGSNHVYGKTDSKVTLTEFVDFQCEACYSYFPTVKEVKEKYKDRVKFQIKVFPISSSHQYSRMATKYAEAASMQGKFIEMHDKIFEGQKDWEVADEPREYFETYAKELGLNMDQLKTDISNKFIDSIIEADMNELKRLGGKGTPTFVLNGKLLDNPQQSIEAFSEVLDNALKQADAK